MQIISELSTPLIEGIVELPTAVVRDMKSREMVYLEKPRERAFLIRKGYVRLAYADPSGRLWTRTLLGKGAFFGDMPFRPPLFFADERAVTSGPATIVEVGRPEIEMAANQDPRFQLMLTQTLSSQLAALDRRLQWQLVSPLRVRVATALFDLLCFYGGRCGHGHLIDIRLTQEELAELVVATRPVVSEVLAELKGEEVIDYTRGHICLLNLERLEEITGSHH
jgi:CRP/FNR family transcriptional regulator, cyclic AMP receptor protein